MSNFTVIETQEQLDTIIGERLKRERKSIEKQYEGFMSPEDVQEKYKGYLSAEDVEKKYKGYLSAEDVKKQLDEKDLTIKGYELNSVKIKTALKNNLPYELAGRLNGTNEEEIQADAESLVKLMGTNTPIGSTEPSGDNKEKSKDIAYAKLAQQLNGGN